MKQFIITEELAQTILNYLATRPYAEVSQLVPRLQSVKPFVEPKEDKWVGEDVVGPEVED